MTDWLGYRIVLPLILGLTLTACVSGGLSSSNDSPFAPDVDYRKQGEDPMVVAGRLMDAQQYELALETYTRAAGTHGLTPQVLAGLGTANLALERLGQAESQLRKSLAADENQPQTWNNLGVVLMETGETGEAVQVFKKAYALNNGESDSIRDNLRLALAKFENPAYDTQQNNEEFRLERIGTGNYQLRNNP